MWTSDASVLTTLAAFSVSIVTAFWLAFSVSWFGIARANGKSCRDAPTLLQKRDCERELDKAYRAEKARQVEEALQEEAHRQQISEEDAFRAKVASFRDVNEAYKWQCVNVTQVARGGREWCDARAKAVAEIEKIKKEAAAEEERRHKVAAAEGQVAREPEHKAEDNLPPTLSQQDLEQIFAEHIGALQKKAAAPKPSTGQESAKPLPNPSDDKEIARKEEAIIAAAIKEDAARQKRQQSAGQRPALAFPRQYSPDQIVVSFADRRLYHIDAQGQTKDYLIGIPRENSRWAGATATGELFQKSKQDPRHPYGIGAVALAGTSYFITGSSEPWTIGTASTDGSISLKNEDFAELLKNIRPGTKVTVTWQKFR